MPGSALLAAACAPSTCSLFASSSLTTLTPLSSTGTSRSTSVSWLLHSCCSLNGNSSSSAASPLSFSSSNTLPANLVAASNSFLSPLNSNLMASTTALRVGGSGLDSAYN